MAEPTKILRRLPEQGQIAGVCAGFAEYFNLDVTLVRVIFILLALMTGGGFILVYIIFAVVLPSSKISTEAADGVDIGHNIQNLADEARKTGRGNRLRNYFGAGLILLGLWMLLGQLFPGWFRLGWEFVWPLALIIIGIIIATRRV